MHKLCAVYPSLTKLFNVSIKLCQIPDEWKDATIIPMHKRVSKCEPNIYPPISLTSCVCKILEKYLVSIKFLNANQHCFRHKRSCETRLLATLEDWNKAFKNNKVCKKRQGNVESLFHLEYPRGQFLVLSCSSSTSRNKFNIKYSFIHR